MKKIILVFLLSFASIFSLYAQQSSLNDQDKKAITLLIDEYSESREKSDTVLLKKNNETRR